MKKIQFLLPLLFGAFVITACAADNRQERAVRPIANQMEPAAAQDPPKTENQGAVDIPEMNTEPSEVLATVSPPEDDPTPTAEPALASLPVIAPAPGWQNETWINTDTPLLLEDLRGKVVLLEFWTFG